MSARTRSGSVSLLRFSVSLCTWVCCVHERRVTGFQEQGGGSLLRTWRAWGPVATQRMLVNVGAKCRACTRACHWPLLLLELFCIIEAVRRWPGHGPRHGL